MSVAVADKVPVPRLGLSARAHMRLSRKLPDQQRLARFAVVAVLACVVFDLALLGFEIVMGWDEAPLHLLTVGSQAVILLAIAIVYRSLQAEIAAASGGPALLEELRRTQEALETANLVKSRYLANVSHEIRSPLNAIYGYAQLIEQQADVRPQEAARVIRRCAEHMTSLVESLLDVSRLENGVLRLRSEVVRLPDFIEQVVWMMRPAAEAKGLTFVHEVSGRLPEFVRTDQARFRQALINLLSNAIKFTDRGSVSFRVAYRGQIAVFEIADTGPGIDPADHQRVFDPYERVGEDGLPEHAGIGLGLPITKAIVTMLGGKLELESRKGAGATFRITMMLGEVAQLRAPETLQRRICGYEGPSRAILLVDDDADQRGFLERFLLGCGFEVVAVANGETAVELAAQRGFDLAILDISLPGMSGWECAFQLRERAPRDLAVIMASANAPEFHRPEHARPVHDHFLVKPYALDAMAEAIGGLLALSWKWEVTGGVSVPDTQGGALPEAVRPNVQKLNELIRIGHVRGIEAQIGEIAARAPQCGKLVSALYAALDEFDLARMARLLEGA